MSLKSFPPSLFALHLCFVPDSSGRAHASASHSGGRWLMRGGGLQETMQDDPRNTSHSGGRPSTGPTHTQNEAAGPIGGAGNEDPTHCAKGRAGHCPRPRKGTSER